ncbi:MAG: D-alanyl-D-alanine carboxypeptidase [Lachnospiraceae bacterium]|nr:D-alanyl-D-alanine carboxypeptidase [Lachnospiraceae bacterium]
MSGEKEEELKRQQRRERIQRMKLEKERQEKIRKYIRFGVPGGMTLILLVLMAILSGGNKSNASEQLESQQLTSQQLSLQEQQTVEQEEAAKEPVANEENAAYVIERETVSEEATTQEAATEEETADNTEDKIRMVKDSEIIYLDELTSEYALVVNANTQEIVAFKAPNTQINPASMTKIFTILVAAEHIEEEDWDDTFTITLEHTDYAFVHDCSTAGFLDEEVVTVRDLFYGTILPSGGEAAYALACYVAGSHEAFVELMNEKLEELGISKTSHFTNSVGLYHKEHYTTVYDMAVIMKAVMDNPLCKEVISSRTYNTSSTNKHPEGILLSNWFIRRIEDKDCGGIVMGAKTGFVNQSGNCAVSYGLFGDNEEYICVTAKASSSWNAINDHVALYSAYCPPLVTEEAQTEESVN